MLASLQVISIISAKECLIFTVSVLCPWKSDTFFVFCIESGTPSQDTNLEYPQGELLRTFPLTYKGVSAIFGASSDAVLCLIFLILFLAFGQPNPINQNIENSIVQYTIMCVLTVIIRLTSWDWAGPSLVQAWIWLYFNFL